MGVFLSHFLKIPREIKIYMLSPITLRNIFLKERSNPTKKYQKDEMYKQFFYLWIKTALSLAKKYTKRLNTTSSFVLLSSLLSPTSFPSPTTIKQLCVEHLYQLYMVFVVIAVPINCIGITFDDTMSTLWKGEDLNSQQI